MKNMELYDLSDFYYISELYSEDIEEDEYCEFCGARKKVENSIFCIRCKTEDLLECAKEYSQEFIASLNKKEFDYWQCWLDGSVPSSNNQELFILEHISWFEGWLDTQRFCPWR